MPVSSKRNIPFSTEDIKHKDDLIRCLESMGFLSIRSDFLLPLLEEAIKVNHKVYIADEMQYEEYLFSRVQIITSSGKHITVVYLDDELGYGMMSESNDFSRAQQSCADEDTITDLLNSFYYGDL